MLTAFKNKVVGLLINHKRLTLVLSVFFVSGLVFFAFSDQTLAATGDSIARLISLILEMVINFMGKFILLLFNLLVGRLAPYNNFIDARAVQVGWVLTRDISNMFFILVLLAIAFGTILKIEQLNYQKVLPKLLIMAVVINFSKTICGLVIDFGQVVMLTFVNAFVAAAGGNFLNALGLSRLLTLSESGSLEVSDWNLVGAFLLALTMMIIALIVVVVFIIVLAYRIVILWVLVILSPLAFLAGGFPVGKASQAYSQWWDNFTGAVIIGPILAFFLWLALLTAGGGTLSSEFPEAYEPTTEEKTFGELGKAGENYFLTEGGTTDSMVSFVIATALLLAGLMIAQQTGGIMGQFAGSVAGKTKGFVGTALKGTAIGAGALLYKGAKGGAGWGDQQVRGRERMYGALSRVPGFGRFATDKVAKLRQEGGKREAEVAARIPYLTPEERERRKAAPAITAAGKVERRALRRARIEGADDDYLKSKGMDENDIIREKRKEMAALQKEATSANDIEGIKFVKEQYEKSPHLMEDEAERRKVYRTADQQAIQKMSPEARRQTEFLDEFAKRADADDVSKRIGGELRTSYLGYKSEYGANFPGAGVYKGQGKFEPAGAAGARKVFGERTKKVFVQSKLKEAEAKKAQEGAVVPASVMEKAWGEFPEVEVEKGAPSVYGGNIYRDDIREDLTDAQIVGGTAAEVWKVNSKTGQFPSKVDAASFGVELTGTDRTLFNPKSTYVERVRASRSIGSLDIDAIHASTPPGEEGYGKTVIQRLSPKTLKNAFGIARSSSPEDEQKVKAVVKAIHEKLEKELSAERIEELSPEEREMYKKTMEEMNLDPIIRRVVTGS